MSARIFDYSQKANPLSDFDGDRDLAGREVFGDTFEDVYVEQLADDNLDVLSLFAPARQARRLGFDGSDL